MFQTFTSIMNQKEKKEWQMNLIFTYPYNACTKSFRQTLTDSGGAVFLQRKQNIVNSFMMESKQLRTFLLPFKQKRNWHQEQNSSCMAVENEHRRAHAFIKGILGYYLHASVYRP